MKPYLMSNFPSVRPSLNLQFDSQPTPADMTSHLASVGATFSRASIGTYVDANGLVAEATAGQARPNYSSAGVHEGLLIEEARTNLVKSSEDFSTTDWTNSRNGTGSNPIVTINQSIAPDGTASADKIVFDVGAGTTSSDQSSISDTVNISSSVDYTGTIWLKGESGGEEIVFRHTAGTYTLLTLTTEWQRFDYTQTSLTTSYTFEFGIRQNVSGHGVINSTATVYAWGAQLEAGSFPTSYIPTIPTFTSRASDGTYFDSSGVLQTASTNVARTDHKYIDGEWVEAGLLLEGASTNLVTNSEDFSGWGDINVTVTSNDATAPDDTTTATKLTDDSTNGQHRISKSFTTSSSGQATYSIFLKRGTLGTVVLNMFSSGTIANADVNLANGTITKNSGISATIENVDNDWYRCSITGNLASTSTFIYVYMQKTNSISYIGSGDTVFIWGAQLEEQSQPTSYIATSGSTATRSADVYTTATKERSADVCYIDGTAFTDFYNQEQGTFFSQSKIIENNEEISFVFEANKADVSERALVVYLSDAISGDIRADITTSSTGSFIDFSVADKFASQKITLSYIDSTANASLNGTLGTPITKDAPDNVEQLYIGRRASSAINYLNGSIKKMIYFPRALSTNELNKLTQ